MKLLFLYSELAQYTLDCINLLPKEWEIKIIHWPVNPEAPFEFEEAEHIQLIPKNEIKDLGTYLKEENPNSIFVTGWIDKEYSKALKSHKEAAKKVIMFDTSWKATIKQKAGLIYLKPFVTKTFDFAFVTGTKQKEYAQKLGIQENRIFTGLYSANVSKFQSDNSIQPTTNCQQPTALSSPQAGINQEHSSEEDFARSEKTILYLGRYVKHKGIFELWEAFTELIEEGFTNWKLICTGTGDQWDNRLQHPNIEHKGFVQPKDFGPLIEHASFYVLPSHFEPWGVSVHEMAAAGLPMVLSDKVGAKEAFLEEGENGFTFKGGSKDQLKAALKKMMLKSSKELKEMGKVSQQLAQKITPQKWVETVMEMVNA